MIIKEEKKAFPPGTLVTSFSNQQFNCIVTTTWDGFINWRLTTSINTWGLIDNTFSWSPFMKVIWKPHLVKAVIHKLHKKIVFALDKMGEEGKDFGSALFYTFEPMHNKGLILDIKYAWEVTTKKSSEIPSFDKLRETLAQHVDSGMSRLDAINRMAKEIGVRPGRLYKTIVGSPPKGINLKNSEEKEWFKKLFKVKHWFGVSPEEVEKILSTSSSAPSRDDLEQRIRNYTKWGWSQDEALAKISSDLGISPEEVKRIITQSPAKDDSNQIQ
jgi:hypothetical protein